MDREPEIEFEITPRPAAMKKFALSEEDCVDIVAEGLAIYAQRAAEHIGVAAGFLGPRRR